MTPELDEKIKYETLKLCREHNLATEKLTAEQVAEVITQAIKCGDFQRCIVVPDGRQAVIYLPYRESVRLHNRIDALAKALNELCGWVHVETGRHPCEHEQDTTPFASWATLMDNGYMLKSMEEGPPE